jgi:hypothetical protein
VPKFTVLVELPVYFSTTFEIEADTAKEADAKAYELAAECPSPEQWGSPNYGDPQILEVAEDA